MATFAAFLVERDYLTAAELAEVTESIVLYGGRLGTAVVEAGLLTADEVDRALAQHLGLPEIPRDWLQKPDPGARAAVHPDLMKRHRAFPLHFEKRTLHVGLVDPKSRRALDALARASGCLIAPYALTELRFTELMQRVYGVEPSPRFAMLLDQGRLGQAKRKRRSAAAAQPAGEFDLVDEATFAASLAQPARPSPAAGDEPVELTERAPTEPAAELLRAEAALARAGNRDTLIDAALSLAARFAELTALFIVRDGAAAGLRALRAGKPLDVEAIVAPLAGDGVLCEAARTGQPVQLVPATAVDKLVAKALRAEAGAELAAFPIAINGRVVQLLVAHSGGGALPTTGVAALRALTDLQGAAYARLIRFFKAQQAPRPA